MKLKELYKQLEELFARDPDAGDADILFVHKVDQDRTTHADIFRKPCLARWPSPTGILKSVFVFSDDISVPEDVKLHRVADTRHYSVDYINDVAKSMVDGIISSFYRNDMYNRKEKPFNKDAVMYEVELSLDYITRQDKTLQNLVDIIRKFADKYADQLMNPQDYVVYPGR